jgi:uncharacterized protein (DUF1810 family)
MPDDPFGLSRFKAAQDPAYRQVLAELRAGRKTSHWIWFVFPQIAGLGVSPIAQHYAIASIDEARAYLADPLLGGRLRECLQALLAHPIAAAEDMLGVTDAMKLRSSLTLFGRSAPEEALFAQALDRFFDGQADPHTLARLP